LFNQSSEAYTHPTLKRSKLDFELLHDMRTKAEHKFLKEQVET